jgi:hypothetical protein
MINLNRLLIVCLTLLGTQMWAQLGGKSAYQFLNVVASPIQDALGGRVVTSINNDINQGILNPSVIQSSMKNKVGLNYGNYFSDINFGNAAYAYSWGEKNKTILAGVTYMNYGTFDGADEYGQRTGTFTGSETAISFGYAYEFPIKGLTAGTNVKFISSVLETYSSFGGALDLAIAYKKPEKETFYTLVFRNMGTQFTTYAGVKEPLPFEITAGISKKLAKAPIRLHFTFQDLQKWKTTYSNSAISSETTYEKTNFFQNVLHHFNLGVEAFPERIITLRLGYNFRRSFELGQQKRVGFAGLSTGFGVRVKKFRFDFSYSRYTISGNTTLFGAQFNF